MSSTHHLNQIPVQFSRHVRCLRHHVWMAACDDCRDARTARLERERETSRTAG
ncbi:hypothetical protein [Blastococcus litoris]|uniref:hypothetical protein n=1 Tax=Blastococcus litoris TaxID=2171622 RepID=UPI0013DFD4EF|nr:hypothetical protein [Blastococcus litoris]